LNIRDCLRESIEKLAGAGIPGAVLDAEVLIAHACGMERFRLKVYPERELTPEELEEVRASVARRMKHEPVAYITEKRSSIRWNSRWTAGTYSASETELAVDLAVYYAPMNGLVLDLCTGSGAIAVALKHNRSDLDIIATDLSGEALDLAEKNCSGILKSGAIEFRQGNLFAPVRGMIFDCIVSNPPYVDPAKKPELQKDLEFEPGQALYAGDSGRSIVEAIISSGPDFLGEGGVMIIEIGESMRDFVTEKGGRAGFSVSVLNDYGGCRGGCSEGFLNHAAFRALS
jgi:release factor glutamine methyltransferase